MGLTELSFPAPGTQPPDAAGPGAEEQIPRSLVQLAGQLSGPLRQSDPYSGEGDPRFEEGEEAAYSPGQPRLCRDGYVRRSPVQRYRTPAGFHRLRLLRFLASIGIALLIAALAAALWRSGFLRLF